MADRLPVSLLTGFLGSGKTTLLARLLAHPELRETAVIVNELGEVAIDHHLLRRVDERTVLLGNGCVCCTLRADLAEELVSLLERRAAGDVPPFARVIVETTGLADPGPIMQTLASDPVVKHRFRLETVIATVDGVLGSGQLDRQPESRRQAAAADRIVVTKTDAASRTEVAALQERLERLNPLARVLVASFGNVDPDELLAPSGALPPLRAGEAERHADDVTSFSLTVAEPLDWGAFAVWLTMLLQARVQDVLRIKGLLDVGLDGPLLLNGVQHVVHPPEHLDRWPDDDRRSRLVLIARGVEREAVEASLAAFLAAARPATSDRPS